MTRASHAFPPLPSGTAVLDVLCPMHLVLDGNGLIRHAGPAAQKLSPDQSLIGQRLGEVLEVRRPRVTGTMASLMPHMGAKLHVALRHPPRTELKCVITPLPEGLVPGVRGGAVMNMSFGISVGEAVRDFSLTSSDFAVTDLAVEMLYMVEAQSAVMEELKRLNLRLNGARAQAEEDALTDTLTGLGNRRAMDDTLHRFCEAGAPFAVLHVDLDKFKQANDTYGHAAGDAVLQAVALRLRQQTRDQDIILRQGGDEFALILPGLTDRDEIACIAWRLITALEDPVMFDGERLSISASIGASVQSGGYTDPDTVLQQADTALYAVKTAGRRGVLFYDPEMGRMGAGPVTDPGVSG